MKASGGVGRQATSNRYPTVTKCCIVGIQSDQAEGDPAGTAAVEVHGGTSTTHGSLRRSRRRAAAFEHGSLRPRTVAFDHLAFQVQSSLRPRQQWRKCTAAPPTTRPLSGTRPHGTRTVRSRSDCLNKPPVRPAHARHASPCLRICLAYHLSFLEISGPGEGVQKLSLIQLALR